MSETDDQHEQELEIALVIRSVHAQEVTHQIAKLSEIANYVLLPAGTISIEDYYFDTPDFTLNTQGLALRIRKQSMLTDLGGMPNYLLTLKGPAQSNGSNGSGGQVRMEIEKPWSQRAVDGVIDTLKARQINLNSIVFDQDNPLHSIEQSGLRVIQTRKTTREIKNIFHKDQAHSILAELVIDSVLYDLVGSPFDFMRLKLNPSHRMALPR